jgi:FKBP-type peptidyl-prolyl cis-trans isomerase FklB
MRTLLLTLIVALASQVDLQAQAEKTNMDSLSYSLGVLVAQDLKNQGFEELDTKSLTDAMEDVLEGKELKITAEQANANMQAYAQAKQAEEAEAQKAQHIPTIEAGEQFLTENGTRSEVTTTASGLQYEVLTPGSGAKPAATDEVTVHYHGTLLDGTIFDSSVERGDPATFPLNRVISGWTEGLQLMPTGAKYRFYIPYDLAYGSQAAGAKIAPYSTLIFEVELIKIK